MAIYSPGNGTALIITTAYFLWALNIEAPKDAEGREVKPDINAYINVGFVRHVFHPLSLFDILPIA